MIGTYHQRIEYPQEKVESTVIEEKVMPTQENPTTEAEITQTPEKTQNTTTDDNAEENT